MLGLCERDVQLLSARNIKAAVVSVAAGTCWPAEQEPHCPSVCLQNTIRCPHRCPNPDGHNARHNAVCRCDVIRPQTRDCHVFIVRVP